MTELLRSTILLLINDDWVVGSRGLTYLTAEKDGDLVYVQVASIGLKICSEHKPTKLNGTGSTYREGGTLETLLADAHTARGYLIRPQGTIPWYKDIDEWLEDQHDKDKIRIYHKGDTVDFDN